MSYTYLYKRLFLSGFFLFFATLVFAQTTVVTGLVTDGKTNEPLPFVSVKFNGTSVGGPTNNDGKYTISTDHPTKQIKVSFLGYKDALYNIKPGVTQTINIRLIPTANELAEVTVKSGKKPKYRNKDNPAVELIRKVIENKEKNRPTAYDYVEYKEYDKMQFSLANVSNTLADKKFFRKYAFVINNRDTTSVPGKNLLPIFLNEKLSQYYYRRNPEKEKTVALAEKTVNFGGSVDSEGLGAYFKHMYYKVDIYDNTIFLMTNNFLSPIAGSSPTFYKFFITDTVAYKNTKLVELSFTPRNTTDMLFVGKLYITLDGNYAVEKVELNINKNINLNFVNAMRVKQEFEQNPDGRFHVSKSTTVADFGLTKNKKGGLFGIRTITYGNYAVNVPHPDTTYQHQEYAESDEVKHRSDDFWAKNRLDTLTTAESKVYKNTDSLRNMPSFRRTMDIATLLLAGYKGFGGFELGPANTFYSFNPVEGFKLRVGGRTTPELSKRYYFETYGAYGFKDERFKYFLSATYSLNNKSIYKFPQNYLRVSTQYDTHIPGANLQFVQEDNFLLSFKRGENDKYLYDRSYNFDYVHEYENHFSYHFKFARLTQAPAGSLYFLNTVGNNTANVVKDLTTSEVGVSLRYAPNEQFYQGKIYRIPVPSKYPVLTLDYTAGLKNVFGSSNYGYQNLHVQMDKRVYESILGYADVTIEGGKTFGQVPYPLLDIFRANQTYAYDIYSYNLMNFLEFVGDHYASINIDQHFVGFFFNKIPLFKKLKWREVASLKAVYGGLSDKNNPSLHPDLYQFPIADDGRPITYGLGKTPYVEGSVGIENIFKFVRVDLVRRFTYLDHPDVSKWGIRARVKFDF